MEGRGTLGSGSSRLYDGNREVPINLTQISTTSLTLYLSESKKGKQKLF